MRTIVVVTGAPCSGKTSVSRPLSERFDVPLLSRDDIKEMLFEEMGWSDAEWSKKLGRLSYQLLSYYVGQVLHSGGSLVIESNFSLDGLSALGLALEANGAQALTVYTRAPVDVLRARFLKRASIGTRHAGHVDLSRVQEMESQFQADLTHAIRSLPGSSLVVDTTKYTPEQIVEMVAAKMQGSVLI
jgi:cytidylate kinase